MTHLLLRTLLIWVVATGAMAASAEDLFTLKLRVPEVQAPRSVDGVLREAVGIELQRLTGRADIDSEQLQYFRKQPRRWIQRYSFAPYRQEGVAIGQWLQLVFDKAQLLKAMEARGLTYWPAQVRPRLLIIGYWSLQGTQTPLTPALIAEQPDLDLVYAAYLLGLQVKLPMVDDPVAQRPILTEENIAELCQRYGVDGVLRLYFEEQFIQGARRVQLHWESFLLEQNERLAGTVKDATPKAAFSKLLLARMADWRAAFQQRVSQVGEATLVLKTTRPEALVHLETSLKQAAPLVRSVQLVQARQGEGHYSVRWRGGWHALLALLAQLPGVRILEADETSAQVVLAEGAQ